jgi:hypothetical protein
MLLQENLIILCILIHSSAGQLLLEHHEQGLDERGLLAKVTRVAAEHVLNTAAPLGLSGP